MVDKERLIQYLLMLFLSLISFPSEMVPTLQVGMGGLGNLASSVSIKQGPLRKAWMLSRRFALKMLERGCRCPYKHFEN
jgi:hypothetical protein